MPDVNEIQSWEPAWAILRAIAALIWGLSWVNIALMIGAGYLIVQLWKWHHAPDDVTTFDLNDLFMEGGKASQYKISINILLGLSIWAVVTLIDGNHPGEAVTLMIAVLGWFVGGRAVNAIFKPGDVPPPPSVPPAV